MDKIIYRKNQFTTSKEQAEKLLAAMDDFVNSPTTTGKGQPRLDSELMKIWNGGQRLEWEWSEETRAEYERRKRLEKRVAEELVLFKADNEAWKNAKIRPWRNLKLAEWIDDTFIRPLLYDLTEKQATERVKKRQELLNWPARPEFESYMSDEKIAKFKPEAPSWIPAVLPTAS
jgi:hypothetical protein